MFITSQKKKENFLQAKQEIFQYNNFHKHTAKMLAAFCAIALLYFTELALGAAPQVIVIGAGFAGMTTARLAQAR